ncbi:MAG: N-acetyltransferase [Deferribacteraceae bacterium]|jgi:amino-acid N-acetyltransferase|nr:N-acetyltransferase [Deferribacteraceae bacterium]
MDTTIRKALITDAKRIQSLVNTFAVKGDMLMLNLNDVVEKLMEFCVCEYAGASPAVAGVCALHPTWLDIAELRSLAVEREMQNKGIGRLLVLKQLEWAKELGFKRVFTLTYKSKFFASLGFNEVPKDELPKKMWTDCLKCLKYPDCDETAMIIHL